MLHKIAQRRVPFILTACTLTLTSPVSAQVSYEMCSSGAKLVRREKYSKALLEWRKLATDASQKGWLRVSLECLRVTKLATTDEDAFRWMSRAADSSTFARTQLALMYAGGVGTAKDAQQALDLLKAAAAKGDEAAEFLLQILRKVEMDESKVQELKQSKVSGSN